MITLFETHKIQEKIWYDIDNLLYVISTDYQLDFFDDYYLGFINIEPLDTDNEIVFKNIIKYYYEKNEKLIKLLNKHYLKIENKPDMEEIIFETTLKETDIKHLYPEKYKQYLKRKNMKKFNI